MLIRRAFFDDAMRDSQPGLQISGYACFGR